MLVTRPSDFASVAVCARAWWTVEIVTTATHPTARLGYDARAGSADGSPHQTHQSLARGIPGRVSMDWG